MTKAQAAWAYLTALFLIAGVVMTLYPEPGNAGRTVTTGVCWTVAVLGWMMLAGMIVADTKASGQP
jgi:hypothetical protein